IQFSIVPLSSNAVPASLAGIFPKRQPVQELGKEPVAEKPGELVVGQFESLLIAGAIPALSDNADFAADKTSQFHGAPLYYAWFNAKTVFSTLARIPATPA